MYRQTAKLKFKVEPTTDDDLAIKIEEDNSVPDPMTVTPETVPTNPYAFNPVCLPWTGLVSFTNSCINQDVRNDVQARVERKEEVSVIGLSSLARLGELMKSEGDAFQECRTWVDHAG